MKIKISDYKGNVVTRWKVPRTKRQLTWTAIKLVRLYYRCKETGLLTNELISVLKEFIETMKGRLVAVTVAHPEIAKGINEIRNLTPHDLEEEIILEKIREHRGEVCSLCGTDLRFPAFIAYRKGLQVIKYSRPVGIFCLKGTVGKLRNLISSMTIELPKDTTETKYSSQRTSQPSQPQQVIQHCLFGY